MTQLRKALAGPFAGMAAYRQFVLFRLVPSARPGKMDKLPCNLMGVVVSAHDPKNWTDWETACAAAEALGLGVGFVFTAADPFWFLDTDGSLRDGQWSPLALSLYQLLPGVAAEISGSGSGGHMFGTGTMPPHACKNEALGLELYTEGRFVALTGVGAVGDCMVDCTAVLPALVATYFPPDARIGTDAAAWQEGPREDWNGPVDDVELLRRLVSAKPSAGAAFEGRATFRDLWEANEGPLSVSYPDPNGRPYDASSADAALAQHLAWATGCDCPRMERLMRQSALYRVEKWERKDYLERTIVGAISRQDKVLGGDKPKVTLQAVEPGNLPALADDGMVLASQMEDHFKGCVYIESLNRALLPDGTIIKPEAFNVRYGGKTFTVDAVRSKLTEDAWKAWTQSKEVKCVSAHGTTFRPDLPLGEITYRDGLRYVNTYIPIEIKRASGDVNRFLNHLAKLLPIERDRTIFLSYIAAIVQYQGKKFQWAPLLQGVPGNGKSFFSYCVQYAVGERYTHWPTAKKIAKDFNAWMVNKVLYAVEDIYVPDSKREIMEDLKPMITGRRIEIEMKGVDQVTSDICGNFIFNSNHKDGILKSNTDRRYAMLFTAQQTVEDLERDEMLGDYMPSLYKWLRSEGHAFISEFLYTFPIPAEFNPAGDCQRAPETSSLREAIEESKGNLEQAIEEAIEIGMQGFSGGWISTIMLDRYLDENGFQRVSRSARKRALQQMGYCLHPGLPNGRVNNLVVPDNSKPRLYVLQSNKMLMSLQGHVAEKAYEGANRAVVNHPWSQSAR